MKKKENLRLLPEKRGRWVSFVYAIFAKDFQLLPSTSKVKYVLVEKHDDKKKKKKLAFERS